jgi:cytidylate kinase
MGMVVTIDGPAASGKSSVSRELAKRLGWLWVSTGAFYRGLAYVALQMGISFDDVKGLSDLARSNVWSVQMSGDNTLVFFKGQDVTDSINDEAVGSFASKVSHYPEVRKALLEGQRSCSEGPQGLVAEGRDCGTVVFPSAQAKIYLTASSELRAQRRAAEQGTAKEEILEAQKVRDQQDSTRKAAPLQIPENALVVDTSKMNFIEVVNVVEDYVRKNVKI